GIGGKTWGSSWRPRETEPPAAGRYPTTGGQSMKSQDIVLAVILAIFTLGSAPAVAAEGETAALSAELTMLSARAGAKDRVNIRSRGRNAGSEPLRVLKMGTPLEGQFNAPYFVVQTNGADVAYIGRLVKRRPPTEDDYIVVAPHGELSA